MKWKPIETAPEGTHILLAHFADVDGSIEFVWAASGYWDPDDEKQAWIDVKDDDMKAEAFNSVTHWAELTSKLT